MSDFNLSRVTDEGAALLALAVTKNHRIIFTRLQSGDGVYSDEEKESIKERTELKSPKQNGGLATWSHKANIVTLTTNFNNIDLEEGYYFRELGVYARDGTAEGEEILYAVAYSDKPSYMPAKNPEAPATIAVEFNTAISSDATITIEQDIQVYALAEDVEALRTRIEYLEAATEGFREVTETEIDDILEGDYDPEDPNRDDTGEIDEDGTLITEATDEEVADILSSLFRTT